MINEESSLKKISILVTSECQLLGTETLKWGVIFPHYTIVKAQIT